MRILFITATRVGDAILSTGLLHHLLQRHPGARVTVACGPAAASLFDAVPGLERTIVLQKMQFSLHWVELWAACAGRLWDVLVDLRNAPLARLLAARRAYRATRGRQNRHRVAQLAGVLGLDDDPPAPHLWTGPAHEARARDLIADGAPVLAVGPTANWIAKTWRPERFAEAIARLTGPDGILPGGRVAVFGRDDERPQALGLLDSIPAGRRIDLVGHLDLVEVFACLRRCAFYLGNDSGLMHLAAAAGIPTLGLFGPSPVDEYAPWGGNTATVHTAIPYTEIFPPNFDPKDTGTLMDSLSVDAVEAAARALWGRTREAAA
ncbi:MAG: glycosyltransferase family 9 protein [Hyphomicrobiales bacterium]|nr:glycosyltransferase family 9 protein [Hyphomicrobiales bacterium]